MALSDLSFYENTNSDVYMTLGSDRNCILKIVYYENSLSCLKQTTGYKYSLLLLPDRDKYNILIATAILC